MAESSEKLIAFLAREHDAMGKPAGNCPDENTWAALEIGLISPGRRDELLAHARLCGECRRRMGGIVAEWPADVSIAESGRTAERGPLPYGRGSDRNVIFRVAPRYYAIAAALLLAVTLWMAWPGGGPDVSMLGAPVARLTDTGRVGILHRRTLSIESQPADTKKLQKLIAELRTTVAKKPDDADAWLDLGRALEKSGEPVEALSAIKRSAELVPSRADVHNALGMRLYLSNEYEAAISAFERAISMDSARADYHLNAALTAEELNRKDAAVKYWNEFLRLAPNDKQAEEVRLWLQNRPGE